MQVITQGDSNIQRLIAAGIKQDVMYKPSTFLIKEDVDEGILFCNTLTGELALLSENEKRAFDELPSFPNEKHSELIKHGYVMQSTCNELKLVEQLHAIFLKRREAKGIINQYNILPTTGCNARCFYCYESNIKRVNMTKETADGIISFISAHHGNSRVKLLWFGGEPTLGIDKIDYICKRLKELNIIYESEMVSNGYLFDRDIIKKAKELWKLYLVQITLDGTESIYNKTKAYVDINDNPFQRVLRNIRYLLDQNINVNIRLNFDDHNGQDLRNLIRDLTDEFRGEKKLAIYVKQLDEDAGFNPIKHTKDDIERLKSEYKELQDLLEFNGWSQIWRFVLPKLVVTSCMADDPAFIQIAPDGTISKCEDYIFEHAIGNIKEGIINKEQVSWWRERIYYDSCKECPLLPSCRKHLKNCPIRINGCDVNDKNRRIQRCHALMVEEYEKWKNTHLVMQTDSKQI